MDIQATGLNRWISVGCILLAIVAIYCFPIIATAYATRAPYLPPLLAPDLSLYLNLSNLHFAANGEPINPYFGNSTQFEAFSYFSFRLAFQAFGILTNLFTGNLWTAALVWDVVCWIAICGGCFWFFEEAFPNAPLPIHAFSIGLLLLVSFSAVKSLAMAGLGTLSPVAFENFGLPYIRLFFPQTAIAWLLLYLALQARALRDWRLATWAWMFLIQGFAFAMFPFATIMMAGTTSFAVLAFLFNRGRLPNWTIVILFGLACTAVDLGYCLRNWPAGSENFTASLIEFHPEVIMRNLTSESVLLAALTVATAVIPTPGPREAKWTVVGLGSSCTVLLFGDAVFAPGALQVSYHATYFVHGTIAIEISFLAAVFYVRFARQFRWARWATAAVIALLFVNGALIAFTTYRSALPANRAIGSLAQALKIANPQAGDLVIARGDIDGPCAWVPLLTPATVLFCRDGEVALTMAQKHTLFRVRQALYLYFTGRNSRWLENVLLEETSGEVTNLGFLGEMVTKDEDVRKQGIASMRAELVPLLSDVEAHAADLRSFFHGFDRVLVIDDIEHPRFSRDRLAEYLALGSENHVGGFSVYWAKPI
jgi:hypothetical protein